MKALVLGGTAFLGIHLTQALLARGHEVTHFNRGRTRPAGLEGARTVLGDRTRGFDGLENERFDAVIDTSGYLPGVVDRAARFFAGRAGRYAFVSTISVYDTAIPEITEETRLLPMPEGASRDAVTGESYGPLKALCEEIVTSTFRHRALLRRPGLIVGPHDPTDRFTYWPQRFARGGDVLVPGPPQRPVQFVDARDLAEFAVRLLEREACGACDVTSPPGTFTMGGVADACARAAGAPSRVRWAGDDFLEGNGVEPWIELPLWIPASLGIPGMLNVRVGRGLVEGLRIRPLSATVADTLAWARTLPRDRVARAGMDPGREAELLRALDA